jgi:hypothetical protein
MAEIFPDEGLDYLLGIAFKAGTVDTTLFMGLFTSQTATTVPARTATGGASPSGWTEMTASSGSYARIAVATGDWGAAATNGSGRRIALSAAKQFTGFVGAAAANGFFLATNSASGAGDVLIYFSNFDSGVARTMAATGDQLNITARAQFDG